MLIVKFHYLSRNHINFLLWPLCFQLISSAENRRRRQPNYIRPASVTSFRTTAGVFRPGKLFFFGKAFKNKSVMHNLLFQLWADLIYNEPAETLRWKEIFECEKVRCRGIFFNRIIREVLRRNLGLRQLSAPLINHRDVMEYEI